jgi:hypothetical protein
MLTLMVAGPKTAEPKTAELPARAVGKKDFWTGAFFGHNLQRRWGMLLASTIVWEVPSLEGSGSPGR